MDHHGQHYVVEDARLYTLPQRAVPILVSGLGPKGIDLAARAGDGLVTTKPEKADVDRYIVQGGRGPVEAGVKVCWGESEDAAAELAHRLWANQGLPGSSPRSCPARGTSSRAPSWSMSRTRVGPSPAARTRSGTSR